MALINCPECNREVSDRATTCPQCGYPLQDFVDSNIDDSNQVINEEENEGSLFEGIVSKYGKNKIAAVKEVHDLLGLSLKEAKDKVDFYHKQNKSSIEAVSFKITKTTNGFYIDENNKMFKYGMFGKEIPFNNIIDVDIYENGSSVTKTSTPSMIGRAAIGSMISPVGTIIGGVTGKKNSVDLINEMKVLISTKDMNNPLITIDLKIPKKTKKDSKDYSKAMKKAQEIEATIRALAYR